MCPNSPKAIRIAQLPPDLVVDQWVSVESSSPRDFLLLHDLWTTFRHLLWSQITSAISTACDFITKSGGIWNSAGRRTAPTTATSHPPAITRLLLFNREGDCLAAKLRPGNVHSAEDWEERLRPEIDRQQQPGQEVVFRADAAFATPAIDEALEARDVKYAIRIPANDSLERDIAA
jgi:hypothetical protein